MPVISALVHKPEVLSTCNVYYISFPKFCVEVAPIPSLFALSFALFTATVVSCYPRSSSLESRGLFSRQVALRSNSTTFSSSCWDTLNIPQYLFDPTTGWNQTTPLCTPGSPSTTSCCIAGEPWSTCFLRLAYGKAATDCSTLESSQSCAPGPLDPNLPRSIQAQVRYVENTIITLYTYFSSLIHGM